jgi:hypothetical protein
MTPQQSEVTHSNGVTTYTPHAAPSAPARPANLANRPNGGTSVKSFSNGAQTVNLRPNGRVASVRGPGFEIRRTPAGGRTVVTRQLNGSILVSTGPHRGYLERTVVVQNRTLMERTYLAGGRTFTRVYLGYRYGGLLLPYYVPAFYYPAAFYGWAYYPWAAPIPYAWTWTAEPWFALNAGYFAPYAVYPSGYAWLTDYALSQTLANAYADRNQQDPDAASYDDSGADQAADDETLYAQEDTPITPELKNEIAADVQHDLAYESAVISGQAQESAGEFPGSLKPGRVFVVATQIDVATPDDRACSLTAGDVLRLDATAEGSGTADLRVASSHREDCPAGIDVTVSLADLQDMVNSLRAQVDAGLAALHAGQGRNGLPAAPQTLMGATQQSALPAPPPDPSVDALIGQQRKDALVTEKTAVQSAIPNQQ